MGNQGVILTDDLDPCTLVGLSLERKFPIGRGPLFPVYLTVEASAVKKFKGKREYELRRRFYYQIVKIGNINKEKLFMASKKITSKKTTTAPGEPNNDTFSLDDTPTVVLDHPHANLALISQRIGFKLPDVLPQDYAMCEVAVEVTYITTKSGIEEESANLLNRIGPIVMGQLDTLARECGGVPVFTVTEEKAAQEEADKESKK